LTNSLKSSGFLNKLQCSWWIPAFFNRTGTL